MRFPMRRVILVNVILLIEQEPNRLQIVWLGPPSNQPSGRSSHPRLTDLDEYTVATPWSVCASVIITDFSGK